MKLQYSRSKASFYVDNDVPTTSGPEDGWQQRSRSSSGLSFSLPARSYKTLLVPTPFIMSPPLPHIGGPQASRPHPYKAVSVNMMSKSLLMVLAGLAPLAAAQDVYVPNTCIDGYQAGVDTALVTLPYGYDAVMSIIGSYQNLTWSGSPPNTVSLNGSDNTVGTARTYDIAGAHVVETLLYYSKPPAPGPYQEIHNTANLTIPAANVSLYIIYDGTVVSEICDGRASVFNFTAKYCGSNGTAVGALLHEIHTNDALTVGKELGGMNFTSCDALMGGNATGTTPSPPPAATYTGAASTAGLSVLGAGLWLMAALL